MALAVSRAAPRPALGVYPGSFNPPTVAHLAIAEAAWRQGHLTRVDLAVSRLALGKADTGRPSFDDRVAVLERIVSTRPWLGLVVTESQLIADIAEGYDAVVVGADKWAQIVDPAWYGGSTLQRDVAVARLPKVLLVPRPPVDPGQPDRSLDKRLDPGPALSLDPSLDLSRAAVEQLVVDPDHGAVSSSAVRAGNWHWMAPEAAAFDAETGAWSDARRYAAWLVERAGERGRHG